MSVKTCENCKGEGTTGAVAFNGQRAACQPCKGRGVVACTAEEAAIRAQGPVPAGFEEGEPVGKIYHLEGKEVVKK